MYPLCLRFGPAAPNKGLMCSLGSLLGLCSDQGRDAGDTRLSSAGLKELGDSTVLFVSFPHSSVAQVMGETGGSNGAGHQQPRCSAQCSPCPALLQAGFSSVSGMRNSLMPFKDEPPKHWLPTRLLLPSPVREAPPESSPKFSALLAPMELLLQIMPAGC